MFNQNFKVMKQKIFTLILVIALAIVANIAFAAPEIAPLGGGTYDYSISAIEVETAGTVTFNYSVAGVTFSAVTYDSDPVALVANVGDLPVVAGGATLAFKMTYATTTQAGTLTVTIADGGSCSNYIQLAIDPIDDNDPGYPSLALTIAADNVTYCPPTVASPATNGSADAKDGSSSSITFTVTINGGGAGTTDYDLDFDVTAIGGVNFSISRTSGTGTPTTNSLGHYSVAGASDGNEVWTVSWTTDEMDGELDVKATTSGATLTATSGGGTYTAIDDDATSTIQNVPSIGAFN
jgi:hypothetical protein